MRLRTRPCSNCGAPLQAGWATRTIECSHCRVTVAVEDDVVMAKSFHRAAQDIELPLETRELARVRLADVPYRVLGRLARGASSDVFYAERAQRITERVVLKLLRAATDLDLLDREWETLRALRKSRAQGAAHFITLLPRGIARGDAVRADGERAPATALGFQSGFVHTAEALREAHAAGLDPRHGVWIWRRLLELLGFLHASGCVHGAVLPKHVLIHARDHGAKLVGYSCADAPGDVLRGVVSSCRAYYPTGVAPGTRLSAALDLSMSARVVLRALGAEAGATRAPASVPEPVARVLERAATLPHDAQVTAHELHAEITEAAKRCYGAPRYVPLHMPRS